MLFFYCGVAGLLLAGEDVYALDRMHFGGVRKLNLFKFLSLHPTFTIFANYWQ